MQLDLPLPDHVQRARYFRQEVRRGRGEMFITLHYDIYWLEVRTFDGLEVEWRTLMKLPDKQVAMDIKAAGICTDWLDCLKDN